MNIPEKAARCVLLIRHAKSVQGGENETRTLREDGVELCKTVRPEYSQFLAKLIERFGGPEFHHSPLPRALLTAFLIFRPEQLISDPRIALQISLKAIGEGAWISGQKARGRKLSEIIRRASENLPLFKDQSLDEAFKNFRDFVSNPSSEARLVIGAGHEPLPSVWIANHTDFPKEELGLAECQAYVFFSDSKGNLLSIEKFTPEATL